MKRWLLVSMMCFLAATCPQPDVEEFLTSGTDYTIDAVPPVTYVLVIDRSGSMRGEKLMQAKEAAENLIDSLQPQDKASIVSFDSSASVIQKPTHDKSELKEAIHSIEAGDFTRYKQAIELATQQFGTTRNIIIFISDGKPDEQQSQILGAVQNSLAKGGCFFTIAYAQQGEDTAQELLAAIAQQSQETNACGGYFSAKDNSFDLSYIFTTIYTEISAKNVFDLQTSITQESEVVFDINIRSSYNQELVDERACFSPQVKLVITQEGEVIHDKEGQEKYQRVPLSPGSYQYFVTATETCGGQCLYRGSESGNFQIQQDSSACFAAWDEIHTLLTANDNVEVHITSNGFEPQSISTDGIVTWKNLDNRPHKIASIQGAFSSPTLQPGDSWTHALAPGDYSYVDVLGSFSGFLDQPEDSHEPVDVIFMIDSSGSMAGQPLKEAQASALELLQIMSPQDRVGVISFNDQARKLSLTAESRSITTTIQSLVASGPTSYTAALNTLQSMSLDKGERRTVIILLSDGLPHDSATTQEMLQHTRQAIGKSCLYAIGYGSPEPEASALLTAMAQISRKENDCGAYYFSSTRKEQLSAVFGEIYADTEGGGLEFSDTILLVDGNTIDISTRVRSESNGKLIPSSDQAGCIPPAEVYLLIGGGREELTYENERYSGQFTLPPGEYNAFLHAKIANENSITQVATGSTDLAITIEERSLALLWPLAALVCIVMYAFMKRRDILHHHERDN